jgi:signal transduction histidine kinase
VVVLRGDALATATYVRPELAPDWRYLALALIGAGYLLIGLYTLIKDRQGAAWVFYLWCLASAAVYLITNTSLADSTGRALFLLEELARLLLPPLTLHLFLVFPDRPVAALYRRLLPFVYLPAAVLAALELDLAFFGGRFLSAGAEVAKMQALDRAQLYHLGIFALASVATLAVRLARHQEWEQRRQFQWVLIGLAAGYVPFVAFYLTPLWLGVTPPSVISVIAVLPLALVPLSFAYAILRYKLWDLGTIVRDVGAYSITLLLGLIGYKFANLAIERGVPTDFALAHNLLNFAAGLVIASLMVPAKRSIASTIERMQFGGAFGKRRSLAELGRELLLERDLDALCATILQRLEDGLDLERANLYLAQSDGFVPVRPESGLPNQLGPEALGPTFWTGEGEPLPAAALPLPTAPPVQRLVMFGYRYAFPLRVRQNRIGAALVGNHRDGSPLSTEDLDLVHTLLNQASLAIENAQLVDQLHRQLEERVLLERHKEGIIESSPAGIAVLGKDDRVESANLAFAALAGVQRPDAVGKRLQDLLPIQPLPEPGSGLLETSFCDSAGLERHLQLSVAILERIGAGPQRVLVIQDVSDRVAMEHALREKDRMAALGMLAAGVAHEVNTPITGISSYAQMLLADTDADDPRYELLKKVEKQTFRAARIVNSLLEFARDREHEARPVELGALLNETTELLRERFANRGIRLAWQAPQGAFVVSGSDGELQQVFTNLLINSIDALSQRGGTVALALARENGRVRVVVEDDGPGIPASLAEKIFQPFFSTKLGQGGTGLGLSISYALVERHGGTLRHEQPADGGCRFIVDLPASPVEDPK